MDSMTLFIASLAVSCIGALASVLLIKADNAAKTAGCLIGAVAAVLSFIAGLEAVLGDVSSLNTVFFFPFARLELLLNGLAGLIVILISILAFAGFIYGLSYFDEYPGKVGRAGFFMNTFVASMMLVITADNVFWFLVAFELMSLTSYFLVVIEENKNSIRGGWLYFVIAHVGFVLIMASFLLMTNGVGGSFSFSDFRTHDFGPAVSSACFVLAFFGFGAKAGIIPLHSWLPQAHPEAPSNVSALMSGGMIKIGILGILKVGLDLLAGSGVQLWWGLMVLVFGSISSVLGVVYALHEHDIKRLLAYHSVENIGIILLGVGASMTAHAWATTSSRRSRSWPPSTTRSTTPCSRASCSSARAPCSMPRVRATWRRWAVCSAACRSRPSASSSVPLPSRPSRRSTASFPSGSPTSPCSTSRRSPTRSSWCSPSPPRPPSPSPVPWPSRAS